MNEPASASSRPDWSAEYIEHNIPPRLPAGAALVFRVVVRNTGKQPWRRDPADGHFTGLAIYIGDQHQDTGRSMRHDVAPGETTTIAVAVTAPASPGRYELRADMVTHCVTMFSDRGTPPLRLSVSVEERRRTRSEQLREISKARHYWFFLPSGGVHLHEGRPAYPLFAESARGCILRDVEGRQFVDYVMGWGCSLLGYDEPRIRRAVRKASGDANMVTLAHRREIEVAEALSAWLPGADMVLFGKNGSDVCTLAVRMARAFTNRPLVLACGYHGWQDWYAERLGFGRTSVPDRTSPLVLPFPYLDLPALQALLQAHAGAVAAVMLEPASPVEGLNGPLRDAGGEYLREVARLTREAGALLVFDEIMSGFRYRQGSAQRAHGVTPDLTCLGKALGGGHALSAVVGRADVFRQTLHRVEYTPTYKGETGPLAAAAAALAIHRTEDVAAHVWEFGETLRRNVNALCRQAGFPGELIGPPFRMTLRSHEPEGERQVLLRTLIQQELLRRGVITFKGFMLPSRAHDDSALRRTMEAFEGAVPTVARAWREDRMVAMLEIPDQL